MHRRRVAHNHPNKTPPEVVGGPNPESWSNRGASILTTRRESRHAEEPLHGPADRLGAAAAVQRERAPRLTSHGLAAEHTSASEPSFRSDSTTDGAPGSRGQPASLRLPPADDPAAPEGLAGQPQADLPPRPPGGPPGGSAWR